MSEGTHETAQHDGVFIVLEYGYSSPVVIGAADSLHSAMCLVLDVADFEYLVPSQDDPEECVSVLVNSGNDTDAYQYFRWVNENAIGNRFARFDKSEGEMVAYFQDQASPFRVFWRSLDTRR